MWRTSSDPDTSFLSPESTALPPGLGQHGTMEDASKIGRCGVASSTTVVDSWRGPLPKAGGKETSTSHTTGEGLARFLVPRGLPLPICRNTRAAFAMMTSPHEKHGLFRKRCLRPLLPERPTQGQRHHNKDGPTNRAKRASYSIPPDRAKDQRRKTARKKETENRPGGSTNQLQRGEMRQGRPSGERMAPLQVSGKKPRGTITTPATDTRPAPSSTREHQPCATNRPFPGLKDTSTTLSIGRRGRETG